MEISKIRPVVRQFFIDYRYLFISYGLLILLSVILFPQEVIGTLVIFKPSTIIHTITGEPMIYIPLVILVVFLILNKVWGTTILYKERTSNIIAIIIFTFVSSSLLMALYAAANPANVVFWSNTFMNADHRLFGVYPAFWMFRHMPHFLEWVVVSVYLSMTVIVTFWIIVLFVYEKGVYLKKFIHQLFFTLALCFPFWIIFQCICPAQMYVGNILHQPMPVEIARDLSGGPPTKFLDENVLKLVQFWTDPSGKSLAISTFPSMHTVWGFLMVYSAIEIFRKKKYGWAIILLASIVALANIIGAVYLLQHYAIDILAGLLLTIIITKIKFVK